MHGVNRAGPSLWSKGFEKPECVCGWGMHSHIFHLRSPGSLFPSHETSLSLTMVFELRTYIANTSNNIDGLYEYFFNVCIIVKINLKLKNNDTKISRKYKLGIMTHSGLRLILPIQASTR